MTCSQGLPRSGLFRMRSVMSFSALLALVAILTLPGATGRGVQATTGLVSSNMNRPGTEPPAFPGVQNHRGKLEWWALSKLINAKTGGLMSASTVRDCSSLPLSRRQRKICLSSRSGNGPALITVAGRASLAAVRECWRQFRYRFWTCPHFKQGPLFGRGIKNEGTREAAFVHSLMAASLAHETTVACRKGVLENCGCIHPTAHRPNRSQINEYESRSLQRNISPLAPRASASAGGKSRRKAHYQWSTRCFDNVEYGAAKAEEFVVKNARYVKRRARQLMNLHNHRAGIEATKFMDMKCQCQGVTSSCSYRLCWNVVQHFTKISNRLMEMYERAVPMRLAAEVRYPTADNRSSLQAVARIPDDATEAQLAPAALERTLNVSRKRIKWSLVPARPGVPQPTPGQLVYIDRSPDYCVRDEFLGIRGTAGRQCHTNDNYSPGSCALLCCDRGHRTVTRVTKLKCSCKFVYCCRVECKTCTRTLTEHFCN